MRCLFLFGLVFFSTVYYYVDEFVDFMIFEEHHLGASYFVNTKACRMLTLTRDEHDVSFLWRGLRRDVCVSNLDLTSFSEGGYNYLRFCAGQLLNFKCKYHAVERNTDYDNRFLYSREFWLREDYNLTIEPNADIIRAECFINGTRIYNGVHFYVRPPDERLRRIRGLPPLRSSSDPGSLSVLIMGLDSTSQMHFPRSMANTANFLLSLPHVELKGFNRLGNNTFDCLMPLLSGLSGSEMANLSSCLDRLDSCPFIWKAFQKAGYETALGEDNIDKTMFPEQGFEEPPTDHYLRPALIEMWLKTRHDKLHGTHCNEKDNYAVVLREFFYKTIPHHQRHRFFTFLWWTQGIDHLFNYGRKLDVKLVDMFKSAAHKGVLKNTLLLVVSNHGLNKDRFYDTVQGKVEENLPMAILCYPKWLEERFPRAISNLKVNSHRLVTAYDLHATLLDLPDLTSLEDKRVEQRSTDLLAHGENLPWGISLFLPVPDFRDCTLAHIPIKYCLCQKLVNISTTDGNVLRAARLIVRNINKVLTMHIPPCHKLYLKLVLAVDKWRRTADENQSELTIRLLTTPGEGQFEGVVRYTGYKLALNGGIRRINDFGNDSYCIDNYLIDMYCFCS